MTDNSVQDMCHVCFQFTWAKIRLVISHKKTPKQYKAYRPFSQAGDPIAVSSMAIVKIPSNGRSSRGFVTSAEIRTTILHVTAQLARASMVN